MSKKWEEVSHAVVEAVKAKRLNSCGRCNSDRFQVSGFILLEQRRSSTLAGMSGATIPAAAVICGDCGLVNLHSVLELGVSV
jgi:hypothetical protein